MNGRIYDPRLARFMQADPLIQAATNTQSLNRYSYVWNNPLNKIDPSGYAVFTLAVGAFLMAAGASVHLAVVFTMMAFAGMLDALHAGATFQDAFRSGIISGLSAVAFTYIGRHFAAKGAQNAANSSQTAAAGADWGGSMYTNFGGNTLTGSQVAQQISAHAAVGGITAVAQGGKFGHGFLSAGITKGITGAVHGGPVAVRLSASMAIGGTVSKISGGKFANGAKTAAFQFMFNEWASKMTAMNGAHILSQDEYLDATGFDSKSIARREAEFNNRMSKMLEAGHAGKGVRINYKQALWWRINANGATLTLDGRVLPVWKLLGRQFISPFSSFGEDLKVLGNVSVDTKTGHIKSEKFDFTPELRGNSFVSPHPITAARNILNTIAIMRGDANGNDFLIKFEYEDSSFE